jgi:RNA-directed DNA polymerase
MGNYHASFGERDGETRTMRIVQVRAVPTLLSPLLLNIALTGLEDVLTTKRKVKAYVYTRPQGRHAISRKASPRYGYIRYADDMLVTASSKEDIDAIVPTIEQWLVERG